MKFIKSLEFKTVEIKGLKEWTTEPCPWMFNVFPQGDRFEAVYYAHNEDSDPLHLGEFEFASAAMIACEDYHQKNVLDFLEDEFVDFAKQFLS